MKKITLSLLLIFTISTFSQNNLKESWSFGLGLNNHTMQGDHRSIGTDKSDGADTNHYINIGGYIYADKMFSPAFGIELKGFYTQMAGAAQELSNGYPVKDAPGFTLGETYFEGTAFGGEFTTIINFSSLVKRPYKTKSKKINFAGYFGIGLQQYDSKLYDSATNDLLVDFSKSNSENGAANSVYYTMALGLKYKLSKNFDLELRESINFNEEDHLDAARTDKAGMEVFFQTTLGLVYKINSKNHDNYVWHEKEEVNIEELIDKAITARLTEYDANRDTDKDGFADVSDPCPLRYSKTNNGCPEDTDKDGILDDLDLCPDVAGSKSRYGCPEDDTVKVGKDGSVIEEAEPTIPFIGYFEHVYFDLDKDFLTQDAMNKLNKVVLYMKFYPHSSFLLQGNTDSGGSTIYNQKLSESRANKVMTYLRDRGINDDRFQIVAFGEEHPKFKNLPVNKNNRRVDIILNE